MRVVCVCAKEKMVRVETWRIIATVHHKQRRVKVETKEEVGGQAMNASHYSAKPNLAVAALTPVLSPFPTSSLRVDSAAVKNVNHAPILPH
jgi:hypothetical protein